MRAEAVVNYRYRGTGLEGSVILCPFSQVIEVGSPLGPVSSPAMDGYTANFAVEVCVSSYAVRPRFNHEAARYPGAFRPPLHPWTDLTTLIITSVHQAHS